jgi:hypothetical protein
MWTSGLLQQMEEAQRRNHQQCRSDDFTAEDVSETSAVDLGEENGRAMAAGVEPGTCMGSPQEP